MNAAVTRMVAGLALLSGAIVTAAPAHSDTLTYRNDRFGTSVSFPPELFRRAMEPPANGDGMTFLSEDGASIAVYGFNNALMADPGELADQASDPQGREGFEITYRRVADTWVVLSGFDDGMVFYNRFLFGENEVIHAVLIKYPAQAKTIYDPLVGAIAGSLNGP